MTETLAAVATTPLQIRRRILLSAYAVSPCRGSEPATGWQICKRLSQYHDVTVLCTPGVPGDPQQDFRREISQFLAEHGPTAGLTFEYVEAPLLSWLFQRETTLCRRTVYYLGYAAWQRSALRRARMLHEREPFDLVHHLNITGYREPGYLWKLGVPFVWGPVTGAANMPASYSQVLRAPDRLYYTSRRWVNELQKRLSLRCRRAARAAAHIWAAEVNALRMVEQLWGYPAELLLDTGTMPRKQCAIRDYDRQRPLRLLWSGEHTGRKALPILLHAMTLLGKSMGVELTVMGRGPETEYWQQTAHRLGVMQPIRWTGELPHRAALEEMTRHDALVFTGVQEGAPNVVLEALSLGIPVICHDCCGMAIAVTADCGIKVPLSDPRSAARGFAEAIARLAVDPVELRRLSRGAIERSGELSWDQTAKRIAERYEQVLGARAPMARLPR